MALRIAVAIADVVSPEAQPPRPPALLPAYLPVVINSRSGRLSMVVIGLREVTLSYRTHDGQDGCGER